MHTRFTRRLVALATLATLGAAASAQAATKTVLAGTPPSAQKTFQEKYLADVNAFFPSALSIHVGDSVSFVPVGFHNVNLPKKGGKGTPLLAPTGAKINGEKDAAGADFWFNGQDAFSFNPALMNQQWGKSLTYNGKKGVQSGLPLADKPKPMTVKFTKKGSFAYFCDVHPGMAARVKVLPKSARIPSKKAVEKVVSKQVAAAEKVAKTLVSVEVPANTVQIGAAGRGGVENFGFHPAQLTVAKDTTVKFTMPSNSTEVHTATAGPGNPDADPNSYLGKVAGSFESPQIAGAAFYPSEAPGTVASLTKTLHGNGFWNTGVLDGTSKVPLPSDASVKFAEAGTYDFYCLIHTFMKGQVVVQ